MVFLSRAVSPPPFTENEYKLHLILAAEKWKSKHNKLKTRSELSSSRAKIKKATRSNENFSQAFWHKLNKCIQRLYDINHISRWVNMLFMNMNFCRSLLRHKLPHGIFLSAESLALNCFRSWKIVTSTRKGTFKCFRLFLNIFTV